MRVIKNIDVSIDITPEDCAKQFAHADTYFQARFLNELGRLAENPQDGCMSGWWEWQCSSLGHEVEISDDAKRALTNLWDYVQNAAAHAKTEARSA